MAKACFDLARKFVRVLEVRGNGLVEFEFSVGEPDMAVELIMPKAAFEEFCAANRVTRLAEREAAADLSDSRESQDSPWSWTLHHATRDRFR
jgi:phenol hydroxylase P0 protein